MKELIVLCENFGTSFSGGSTATAQFISHLIHSFSKIKVICKEHDGFLMNDLDFVQFTSDDEIPSILARESTNESIGYGDFYIAKAFIGTGIPFYFHYHDNWPEMARFTEKSFSDSRITDYIKIFNAAEHTFSVSEAKLDFIKNHTDQVSILRNGLSQPITKKQQLVYNGDVFKVLMAGNFSTRKYKKAIELFNEIEDRSIKNIEIDVFGIELDKGISQQLDQYSFVNKKPFQSTISFEEYHLYLNTSLMENLSLSVVDALANCTPVVSFDVGGIREVVNENNGTVIPCYEVDKMLDAILEIKDNEVLFSFDSKRLSQFDWEFGAKQMFSIMTNTIEVH